MGKFGVGSIGFRRVLACIISILIFGLMFAVVRFTGIIIPNFTRNLVMLAAVDLAGFAFLVWKEKPKEVVSDVIPQENHQDISAEVVDEVKPEEKEVKEDDDLQAVMNEIIEENKEKIEQMEKEMESVA